MDWNVSDDAFGIILLGFSLALGLIGWQLANRGFAKAESAANDAERTMQEVKRSAAQSQSVLAEATGEEAGRLAQSNAEIVEKVSAVDGAISEINKALGELTGMFAPARVFIAFSVLAFLASLVVFDVISLDLDAGTGAGTTTETTS